MGFKVASRVRGLSDEAFREAFGAEEQCRSALSRLRWPDGFVCPACGHRGHCVLAGRSLYQCYRCKKQTSSTAGTIFHATKLPLTLWFAAVHLIVTAKNGISSVELGRQSPGLTVNVEPYFDLDAIGILNADIAQGRRHPFGLSRSADVAAVVQIDFNNKPVPVHDFQFNVFHRYGLPSSRSLAPPRHDPHSKKHS